jgi:choline dehydrogenase-like flavoprotein
VNDTALPYRQLGGFLPGTGVGTAGLQWSGVHFRVDPVELRLLSHCKDRYGKKFIPEGMTIQDFGVSYEELEPHFDYAEKVFGTSGTAWTRGRPKSGRWQGRQPVRGRPLARLPVACAEGHCVGTTLRRCRGKLGLSPLRPVVGQRVRPVRRTATGVTYLDAQGREVEQPADIVVVAAFQFHNVRLMLLSGIGEPYDPATGKGTVGRNFAYQNMATIKAFFDKDVHANPFIGAGGNGVVIDYFNADNFDHGPVGFVGGSPMWVNQAGVNPISGISLPDGSPAWGSAWKQAVADNHTQTISMDVHGVHMSYRDNYLSLDPTYKDAWGLPLLRMTLDWKDNDIRITRFMAQKMRAIATAMDPKAIHVSDKDFGEHFDTVGYQTTHLNGGAIMGTDPHTSAVNHYLQSWDVHNCSCPAPRPSRRGWATTRPASSRR